MEPMRPTGDITISAACFTEQREFARGEIEHEKQAIAEALAHPMAALGAGDAALHLKFLIGHVERETLWGQLIYGIEQGESPLEALQRVMHRQMIELLLSRRSSDWVSVTRDNIRRDWLYAMNMLLEIEAPPVL